MTGEVRLEPKWREVKGQQNYVIMIHDKQIMCKTRIEGTVQEINTNTFK